MCLRLPNLLVAKAFVKQPITRTVPANKCMYYISVMFCFSFADVVFVVVFFSLPCNPFLLESASEIRISSMCKNSILVTCLGFHFSPNPN